MWISSSTFNVNHITETLRRIMNIKWTDKITMENRQTETNRNSDKKKKMEIGQDTHYVKKQEQQRKLQWIGILRDIEEEVGRRERGEGQQRMK